MKSWIYYFRYWQVVLWCVVWICLLLAMIKPNLRKLGHEFKPLKGIYFYNRKRTFNSCLYGTTCTSKLLRRYRYRITITTNFFFKNYFSQSHLPSPVTCIPYQEAGANFLCLHTLKTTPRSAARSACWKLRRQICTSTWPRSFTPWTSVCQKIILQ